jgi:hypothetical protein
MFNRRKKKSDQLHGDMHHRPPSPHPLPRCEGNFSSAVHPERPRLSSPIPYPSSLIPGAILDRSWIELASSWSLPGCLLERSWTKKTAKTTAISRDLKPKKNQRPMCRPSPLAPGGLPCLIRRTAKLRNLCREWPPCRSVLGGTPRRAFPTVGLCSFSSCPYPPFCNLRSGGYNDSKYWGKEVL